MNWIDLLTSLEGRINRKPFWIALVCLSVPELIAHITMGERWSAIVSLLMAYPEFALFAKRGHDRNVPTVIPAIFIASATLLNVLVLLDQVGPLDNPNMLFLTIAIPVGVMALILLVDFGFRRGSIGPNRFGPDPLASQ